MPPRLPIRLARIPIRPTLLTTASRLPGLSITASHRLSNLKSHFSTNRVSMSDVKENNQKFKLDALFSVKDRVALITGGGSGIGLMATQALATNGAKVYICGRTGEKLDKVVEQYGKDIPGQIIPLQADVSRKDSIRDLVREIEKREKCLCILINNAGIELNTQQTEAQSTKEMSKNLFEDQNETFELWADTFKTNAAQIFFMTTAFLPLLQNASEMHKGYSGTVINITSISGVVKTAQHHFAYNTSKAAAIHLNTMLSNEVAMNGFKIRINGIAPGVFPSEMTAGESGSDQKSHIPKDKYESKTPARRPGKEEDMANAILFAATNQYLNGQNVIVDGGYVIQAGAGP